MRDGDGDSFATSDHLQLRGSHWRGSDCDDNDETVYPGRRTSNDDGDVDHNCNGISGGNATGTYEDIFCSGSGQRGVVVLGDSASAH